MLTALRQGRVAGLRITVACARSLDEMPSDVYLLELGPTDETALGEGRFDEVRYLEYLEPVLDAAGGPPSWVVDVTRTHRSDHDGVGKAHLSVLLGMGRPPSGTGPDPDLTPAPPAVEPTRDEALAAAADAVTHAFLGIDPDILSLTDEEHHAAERRWSVGLAVPGVARFQVQLGFVPGAPTSAHVRRLPVSEVVDSVGP
jgi:hypothetical protein